MEIVCFAYPERLSVFLLLLPLGGVLAWGIWRKFRALKMLADDELAEGLFGCWDMRREAGTRLMQFFAVSFLLAAWCGPQLCSGEKLMRREALDIAYVLDVSNSMRAKDASLDRLQSAKEEMLRISRGFDRGRKGLVAFAGSAVLQCPLTTDQQAFEIMLSVASADLVEAQGTNFSAALDMALEMFPAGEKAERVPGVRVVVFASDGEDHGGARSATARDLSKRGVKLFVIGVGEEKPVAIPFEEATGDPASVKRDSKGRPVLTSFRPELLRQLAEDADGMFLHSRGAERASNRVLEALGAIEADGRWVREPLYREEVYQYFVLLSVVLLLTAKGWSGGTKKRNGRRAISLPSERKETAGNPR